MSPIEAATIAQITTASWTWLHPAGKLLCVMPYIIAQPCIGVKDKACVEVCPADCISGNDDSPQLYINPEECIDCGMCEPECPVGAIYADADLPAQWKDYERINAEFFSTDPTSDI